MPPFWKTLLGGSSSSSSSTTLSNSNSSNSISNSNTNTNSNNSTGVSPRKATSSGGGGVIPGSSNGASSSSPSTRHQQQQGSSKQQQHVASTGAAVTSSSSSPIVIPGGTASSTSTSAVLPVNTAAAASAGIPISNRNNNKNNHQHSTSIASSKSAISSSNSYADDTDDVASIPETPYSTGHSPSHARHKFPSQADGGASGTSAAPGSKGGSADDDGDGDVFLSEEDDDDVEDNDNNERTNGGASSSSSQNNTKYSSGMSTSFASNSSTTTSSSSGVPNARQSPLKPDIPTTHTILANPLPQPSSGLAAAISSVLPSSSSSSSSNAAAATPPSMTSSNGKASSASTSASSATPGSTGANPATTDPATGPRTFDIDDMITRLLETGYSGKISKSVSLKNSEITALCLAAREVFLSQPTLLELSPPVNIVGDVHGQYSDLIRLFEMCTFPPHANYLFLGDYVDRGKQSLETILLLLCYKVKYPENFFLLRGNHECANVTRVYGFYDECKRRCNLKIWKTFVDVFNCLPIAALVAGKIFCVHGGLSPSLSSMDDIRRISRPTDVPDYGLLNDLLWSDPSDTALDWEDNERGVSYCFGKAVIQEFLTKYDFDLICRAHMVVEDGYEFWNDRTLVTIFSAPNYCGEFDNFASSMLVNEDLLCSFELLKPLDGAALKKELAKCRKKNSAGLLPARPAA